MEKHLMDMAIDRKLVLKETKEATLVYPSKYYQIELNTARMLNELNIKCPENEKLVERRLAQIQKETGTVLDEMQKKAVKEAAENGLFILTAVSYTHLDVYKRQQYVQALLHEIQTEGGRRKEPVASVFIGGGRCV